MCKHQLPKIKTATLQATNAKSTEVKSEDKGVDFVSCGLDRSCPTSVTGHQGQGVRLDQYQSSIGERTDKRRRQKKKEVSVLNKTSTQSSFCTFDPSNVTQDHEFEWYDLDAIRDPNDCARIISQDFNAGLIFTTERQVLSKEVEVNVVNTSVSNKNSKIGQEFDLFFWVNGDKDAETSDDREFRERMEELELEVKSDLSPVPPPLLHLSPSFSSSSCSSSSNHDEAMDQNECDDKGNFFTSWLFEDAKVR